MNNENLCAPMWHNLQGYLVKGRKKNAQKHIKDNILGVRWVEIHTFTYMCAKEHGNARKNLTRMTTFRRRLKQSRGDSDEGDFSENN